METKPKNTDEGQTSLQFMVEWVPASKPPTGYRENRVFCVSTPNRPKNEQHQLARFDKQGRWVGVYSHDLIEGVTYWCDLPFSPEWQAAHPDDFVDCDCSDNPTALDSERLEVGSTNQQSEVQG